MLIFLIEMFVTRNYDNHTPLHLAARYGHLEIVSYLIDEKVPLNPTDRAKVVDCNEVLN